MPTLRWVLTLAALWHTIGATAIRATDAQPPAGAEPRSCRVRLTWGHRSPQAVPWFVKLAPAASGMQIREAAGWNLEESDDLANGAWRTTAGAGDVDGAEFTLSCPAPPETKHRTEHSIWNYLLTHSDADTASRLRNDPVFQVDPQLLTVQLNEEGTRGFSVSVDQLLRERAFSLPELDVFLAAGDKLLTFHEHQAAIQPCAGRRIVDQIEREPEASYEQYTTRWEDMGNPAYQNPHAVPPGHIVGVTWDSAIPKFGLDRWAGVTSDYGNLDKFKFRLDLQGWEWKSQRLADGLPVLTTTFERGRLRLEIEQFAYPLHGPPPERRGDIAMVLLQKVRATALDGTAQTVTLKLVQERSLPAASGVVYLGQTALVEEAQSHRVLFSVQGAEAITDYAPADKTISAALVMNVPATGAKEIVLKLPSPPVEIKDREVLAGLDCAAARTATLRFWEDYLARGAQFRVPEQVVNELFRANLWHAFRLPRRHGGSEPGVRIDLPYSNFAYDQRGTPWPVNQSIYVDYMLYDLRGHHAISAEELAAIFRNNQEPSGHVGGFANWGVYTPSMLYAVAQHGLLSGDRASVDTLLPATLRAGDWCLAEIARAPQAQGPARGLIRAPLNDLSHDPQAWAFNQAYLLRDNVKPAIRAFYSMLACAFSHSVVEPVEHRWAWGQYFGPPSTDGAWFDLYRHMLIQEQEGDTLFLLAATPRKWLEDGKQIEVRRAPTYFGPLSMTVESRAATGTIRASIDMPQRSRPRALLVRVRHPAGKRMSAVKVNGADWPHFDPEKEWLRIANPDQPRYEIVASYP